MHSPFLPAINDTQPWISAPSTLIHMNKDFNIRINVKNNSIAKSFFIIEDNTGPLCFFPITAEIILTFNGNIAVFHFTRYENVILQFSFEPFILELLVSHFGKSSILFNDENDRFRAENISFLRKIKPSHPFKPSSSTIENGISTILNPVMFFLKAKDIWESWIRSNNTQFYHTIVPLKFSFLTWNVAGKCPDKEILSDISKAFSIPSSSTDIIIMMHGQILSKAQKDHFMMIRLIWCITNV